MTKACGRVTVFAQRLRLRQQRVRQPRAAEPRLRRLPHSLHRSRRRTTSTRSSSSSAPVISAPSARIECSGCSARGVAIDTALSSGEEFPYFKEFWLVTPQRRTPRSLTIYALLDSPSLTGAYQFVVRPGEQTAVGVDARLFLRREVKKLGIAPLTSMFFHGENSGPAEHRDFRPEVHDSDGLLVNFGSGEWHVASARQSALRCASAPSAPRTSAVSVWCSATATSITIRISRRVPSCVRAPGSRRRAWGEGRVELVEIPTKSDTNDNVVAYWVPNNVPEPGKMGAWSYAVYWYGENPNVSPGGRVVATRRDRGMVENAYRFVVDFAGKKLRVAACGPRCCAAW